MARPRVVVGGSGQRTRTPVLVALTAMAAVLAIPLVYGLAGRAWVRETPDLSARAEDASAGQYRLARQLREVQALNEQLHQQVADLDRGRDIDRQAYAEVQKSLGSEQQEVASLREQLAFYRGVVSPQALQSGLHVNELRISAGTDPGSYHFDLVLVQAARQERHASGRAELRFIGHDAAAPRSVALAELAQGKSDLAFSFRHFQELGGEFRLPRGFKPQRVVVTLMTDGGDSPHVEEEFEWGKIQDPSNRGQAG
jgi:hypothetical protein